MLRFKQTCLRLLGACALTAVSMPMTAEAQYPRPRCPSCVDGVCLPNRETMGYHAQVWRRWPGETQSTTGPDAGRPGPIPGPIVPEPRREAQPAQIPPRRSNPPQDDAAEEMPSSDMAPPVDPLQDLPEGPDLGDEVGWQGGAYAPYGYAQSVPVQGAGYAPQYASPQYAPPQYAAPQYAPAAYAQPAYVPAQAAPAQVASPQYGPQQAPPVSAAVQYPVQPSAYVPNGPSGVQSAGYEMPVAPAAIPAGYPVGQATYATEPVTGVYPGLPQIPVQAVPDSAAPENNPLRNRSRY